MQQARSVAARKAHAADGFAVRRTRPAAARAEEFLARLAAFRKAPQVYRFRSYFDVLEKSLRGHRVYLVPENQSEVQIIDLQQKSHPQLLAFDEAQ